MLLDDEREREAAEWIGRRKHGACPRFRVENAKNSRELQKPGYRLAVIRDGVGGCASGRTPAISRSGDRLYLLEITRSLLTIWAKEDYLTNCSSFAKATTPMASVNSSSGKRSVPG